MGRRKKYFSDEEKKIANNEKVKQFYWRNKDKLDNKAKAYYWKKKILACIEEGDLEKAEKVRGKAILKGIDEKYLVIEEIINDTK